MRPEFLLLVSIAMVSSNRLEVLTKFGWIRGTKSVSESGLPLRKFLGVPFAKPPLGRLRFKHPLPPDHWNGIRNTTQLPISCVQRLFRLGSEESLLRKILPVGDSNEDCLYLNVWVPDSLPAIRTSVMVYIYGGAFSMGSSNIPLYEGSILATEGQVIVVTFNYRVASFGFLYLDHSEIEANVGLLDQVMAIKWVYENIEAFGGDPDSITIMGESAGSASVGFHLVSTLSVDYFTRAIMQSGSPASNWAVATKREISAYSLNLAEYMECPNLDNLTSVVECLQDASAEDLLANEPHREGIDVNIFRPVVDGFFLKDHPRRLIEKKMFKKSELLIGVNKNEASPFLAALVPEAFPFVDRKLKLYQRDLLTVAERILKHYPREVQQSAVFFYTDWGRETSAESILTSSERMFSDLFFICDTNTFAKQYAGQNQSVYHYFFTQPTSITFLPKWMGIVHGQELAFVFGWPLSQNFDFSAEEQVFSKRVINYWANFAKTGDPNMPLGDAQTVWWPQYGRHEEQSLVLSFNSTSIVSKLRRKHCAFWHEFVPFLIKTLLKNYSSIE